MPNYHRNNSRNTRNSENSLFKKLTKLFSGPIVNHDRQTPRKLRKRDLDNQSKWIKSSSGAPFKKTSFKGNQKLQASNFNSHNRGERYSDFDQMEYSTEISTALDIYADEITTSSELRELLSIKCPNQEIKDVLRHLFDDVMNVEHNLYGWARTTCKYGDYFLYLDVDENDGVKHVIGLPSSEVERLEGEDDENPNYVQFQWNSAGLTLEKWQVAHFRILGNDKYAPYGTSILESSRRIFRQLDLLENAMMAYRIVRAPERRVFYLDVGHIEPQDVQQYVLDMQTNMKKNMIADDSTGKIDQRYNPLSLEEDYYIPVRGKDRGTKIDPLPGGAWTGDVDDVKYLRDKLLTALKIPSEYLNSGDSDGQQSSLAQKDIRFARTILRLQKSIVSELTEIARIHLFTLDYRGEDLKNFKITLNNPSQLAELQELEALRTRFDIAQAADETLFSRRWIYENIFGLAKEEIRRIEIERFTDKKMDVVYDSIENNFSSEQGLGDLDDLDSELGDIPGGLDSGDDDSESDSALLAAPGNRGMTTTPRSKGKMYQPTESDKRRLGARNRHYKSLSGGSITSNTERNVRPGYQKIRRLGNGISESEFERQLKVYKHMLNETLKMMPDENALDKKPNSDTEVLNSIYSATEKKLLEVKDCELELKNYTSNKDNSVSSGVLKRKHENKT